MTGIFWFLVWLVGYGYFGYPALLVLMAAIRPRKVLASDIRPGVSIILSVWNEEDVIQRKIENMLSLDYPEDRMEILVGSDASTDRTDEIAGRFTDPRIRCFVNPQRQGKMGTLNRLAEQARNEILVFADARQVFAKDAVQRLVRNFADEQVGCVSGELILSDKEGATAKGINLYWNYEKALRRRESCLHSMLGATGAIYAIRRALYVPGPPEIILDDMFIPFMVIRQGYRAIFDDSAKAFDEVAETPQEEYRRKVRTLCGNYQIFSALPGMFNPFRSPVAIQLFSHKLLRVIMPFFLIALLSVNAVLAGRPGYNVVFSGQLAFYAMAALGGLARRQKYAILRNISRICFIPYVFCLLNLSALAGFLRFISSGQKVAWEKARRAEG